MNHYTFLLPAYKSAYFEEALKSILSQTYTDYNVIVSDDCSPDDLKSIVDRLADPRVTYRRNEHNIGAEHLVYHWNMLIGLTDADYVIMASDDDVYDSEYLQEMDILISTHPDINVFRPELRLIDGNGKEIWRENVILKNPITRSDFAELIATKKITSGIPQFVFKKNALDEIHGFLYYPYAWFSDDATVMALSTNGLAICKKTLFSFRYSGLSISTKKPKKKEWEGKMRASASYMNYFCSIINDKAIVKNMYNRTREGIASLFESGPISDFLAMMQYAKDLKSPCFNLTWRLSGYLFRIKKKLAHKR